MIRNPGSILRQTLSSFQSIRLQVVVLLSCGGGQDLFYRLGRCVSRHLQRLLNVDCRLSTVCSSTSCRVHPYWKIVVISRHFDNLGVSHLDFPQQNPFHTPPQRSTEQLPSCFHIDSRTAPSSHCRRLARHEAFFHMQSS